MKDYLTHELHQEGDGSFLGTSFCRKPGVADQALFDHGIFSFNNARQVWLSERHPDET
jgi:hypothetical protein